MCNQTNLSGLRVLPPPRISLRAVFAKILMSTNRVAIVYLKVISFFVESVLATGERFGLGLHSLPEKVECITIRARGDSKHFIHTYLQSTLIKLLSFLLILAVINASI